MPLWFNSQSGGYISQLIGGVLAEVRLLEGTVCPQIYLVVITPVPESVIGIDILRSWQYPQSGSLIYGLWTIMVERKS